MATGTPFHIPHPSARLSSWPSLDISDVLIQAGASGGSKLLATAPSFTGILSDDESNFDDVPPFPKDHRPPIFIIQDIRARVLFTVHPGIAPPQNIHANEQAARSIPSSPTIPRMNVVMKEQLFMQAWVENLTSQGPPMHVPWATEIPAPQRKWIPEGLIFPSETTQLWMREIRESRRVQPIANWPSKSTVHRFVPCIQHHTEAVISKERSVHQTGSVRLSVHAFESGRNALIHGRKEKCAPSHRSIPKPGSDKTITFLFRDVSDLLPQIGSGPSLAIRRGKKISHLQLENAINMEYPDLPTPFRSSPIIWSSRFDPGISSPDQVFTDHHIMLSSLRSQYAALASGIPTPTMHSSKEWQGMSIDSDIDSITSRSSSSSDDEWAFEKDLSVITKDLQGLVDSAPLLPPSSIVETAPNRLRKSPDDRCFSCVSPIHSALPPGSQPAVPFMKVSPAPLTGPPGVPLPPCPVLVDLSSSLHIRNISKKVKSVRLEDVRCSSDTSPLVTSAQEFSTAAKRPSPLRNSFTASSLAADDAGAGTRPKLRGIQVPAMIKSRIIKSKLVHKGTILMRVDTNIRHEILPAPRLNSKSTASTLGWRNLVASADRENGRDALAHAHKPWLTRNETDLSIGQGEDTDVPRSRHITPLRNTFKLN